jgi:1-deoxy-D-xylulose 5-phosphate reductoisomerase
LKIDLSKFEVEMLDAALNVWEKEPSADAAMGGIMGVILSGISGRAGDPTGAETIKNDMRQMRSDAEKTVQKRRLQAALLRAKLLQVLAIDSEHTLEENPATPPRDSK